MIQWDKAIIKTPVGYPRTERCTARTTALPFFKEPLELEAPFSAVSDPAHVAQAITFEVGVPYYMDHDGNISTTPAFYFLGVGTESGFTFTPMSVVIDSIGTIYLIGEFEDGVDYYATPDGEITTDITGIYLGVGNADGDIDLDIIEYAVEITSPLDSADIALDVPFTFEATTNVQDGRTLLVVAYQGELTVVLDELTISGGAISGSVTVSESDGFTTGAVQLLAWYSPVVSTIKTVDVTAHTATITNVATTPASPTEATYFELGGDSAYLVGKTLTLQYSTDDSTWLSLGVATVQPDGTWSKDDCQIATAGSYYLRAVYDTDVVESASISVTVESGTITPVDELYDSFDYAVQESATYNIGDCCNSLSDSDEILLQRTRQTPGAVNDLSIDRIDVVAKTANSDITATPTGNSLSSSRYGTAEIDSTYIVGIFYDGVATRRIKYNTTDSVNYNATGGEYLVGCCNIGGTVHFLMNDAKLYSSSYPFTDFSLVKDLSAILPASNSWKPCTYNADDGYLYVLDLTNKKLYTIDLASGTKVSDITMTDATNGIVWHKTSGVGRIHYCYYYSPSAGQYRIKVNILKNSDDA